MSIEFACPHCQKPYRVKKELAGKTARCACGQQIRIPTPKVAPTPAADLTDLFVEADEQNQPLASASPKLKSSYPKTAPFSVGIGSGPLQNLLKGGGLMIAKLGGGAVAGAALAIWYFIRDEKAGAYELSMKIAFTLVAAAMGVGAAAVLIVADAVGKKSNFARWLTLIGLIFAIAVGVVFYFAITGFK